MRWLNRLLAVGLIASTSLWAADGVLPGSGTEGDPYLIEDPTDFDVFADSTNATTYWASGVYTKLACDPNMAGRPYTTAVINGDFSGHFDGFGHKIFNLTIDTLADSDPANDGNGNLGLFSNIEGSVRNLGIEHAVITGGSSSNYLGGLCGKNSGTITDCYTTGSVKGKDHLGGLCGYNNGGTITHCHAGGSVTGRNDLGGLCGYNLGGTITDCYAGGSISAWRFSGGLCGYNSGGLSKGTITNCYAVGSITGGNDSAHLGGLCGINGGTISNCYATGSVTGGKWSRYFGGLCGESENGTIADCYAKGSVTGGEDAHDLGGLCGFNEHSTIINCYSTGSATGQDGSYNFGGFCGVNLGDAINNCFWDTQTSGMVDGVGNEDPDPNGLTGRTTALMQIKSIFTDAGWDFSVKPVWRMCKDFVNYPKLAWEFPVGDFICPDGVDFTDFAVLSNAWLSDDTPGPNWNVKCDLDYSGAIEAGDLEIFAEHWLDIGELPPIITDIVWVTIDDSGAGMIDSNDNPISHGGFTGQMSKYETTSAQYCQYLNAALATGDVSVDANEVIGANGSNGGVDYVGRPYFYLSSDIIYMYGGQITWTGTSFKVRSRDGYDMSNHPVVAVSWYGAMAFCNYYGYCLPTEWEWQAVADHNGEFTYGCGTTIDQTKANYYWGSVGSENYCNPLGLSSRPYTSPVNHYPPYGYGLHDMAGNVFEWTDSWYSDSQKFRVLRGGSWLCHDDYCAVSFRTSYGYPHSALSSIGFRVCR